MKHFSIWMLMYLLYQRTWEVIIAGREGGAYLIGPQIAKPFDENW